MDSATENALLAEYESHSRVIKAAEAWSKEYSKAPAEHDALIEAEAKLERQLLTHFRRVAKIADSFINWRLYHAIKASYDVTVIVNEDAIGGTDDLLFEVIFDTVAVATAIGAQAGQVIYKQELGLDQYSAEIQQAARERVATLVGKTVLPDGQVVDNVLGGYSISDKMRDDIKQSIHTSITLGEDQDTATKRLRRTIVSPKRAEMIARTEAVNSYSDGITTFGRASGAVGKEWQTVFATDICSEYASYGPVPFDFLYDRVRGITGPTAHPNCRCGLRLIYQNELDDNPDLFNGITQDA